MFQDIISERKNIIRYQSTKKTDLHFVILISWIVETEKSGNEKHNEGFGECKAVDWRILSHIVAWQSGWLMYLGFLL